MNLEVKIGPFRFDLTICRWSEWFTYEGSVVWERGPFRLSRVRAGQ